MVFQWDKWSTLPHICLHLQGWVCCNYTVPVSLTALLYPIWFISILVKCRTKFIELTGASGWYWTHVNYIRIGLFWSHRLVARVGQHVLSRKKPKSQGFLIVRSWKWEKKMLESGNAQLRMAKKKKKAIELAVDIFSFSVKGVFLSICLILCSGQKFSQFASLRKKYAFDEKFCLVISSKL